MADEKKKRPQRRDVPRGLARVGHIIAIGSGKGGVGKSSVAVNMAVALKKQGATVGLLDADIYGPSQPGMLGAGREKPKVMGDYLQPLERHGIKFISIGSLMDEDQPVIWRAPIATKMIIQFLSNVLWEGVDYLLVDLPPGTGDVQITLAQQAHLTGAVIVTTPQQVALGVAKKGLQMFDQVNVPILGIIENMSGFTCPKCGEHTAIFKEGGGAKMAEDFGVSFLGGIPLDPALMEGGESGKPVVLSNPESPSAQAFEMIAEQFHAFMKEISTVTKIEPLAIEMTADGKLEVEFPEEEIVVIDPYTLRVNCPCALCVSEDTGKRLLDPKSVPLDIKIGKFERVGRYAVGIAFTDGHNTGLYRYDYLKELSKKQADASKGSFSV